MIYNKEIERLKWKCLMRSERFLYLWKYFRMVALPDPDPTVLKAIDDGFLHAPNTGELRLFSRYCHYLLDHTPETASFDECWQRSFVEESPIYGKYDLFPLPVEDYKERIKRDIEGIIAVFRRFNKRDPNIDELKNQLYKWMRLTVKSTYLVITQYEQTNEELRALLKEISGILKSKIIPKNHRIRMDECNRYLDVFDLRKRKVKWKAISAKVYPGREFDSVRASLQADLRKAHRLISDAETGKF